MALLEIKWRPSSRELRMFAISQLVASIIVAWWVHHRFAADWAAVAILGISIPIAITGVIRPLLVRNVFLAWMIVTFPLGWVMSHLMLVIVYYGVVTPIAVYLRWRGRDSLQLRQQPRATSYWNVRGGPQQPFRYFKQF